MQQTVHNQMVHQHSNRIFAKSPIRDMPSVQVTGFDCKTPKTDQVVYMQQNQYARYTPERKTSAVTQIGVISPQEVKRDIRDRDKSPFNKTVGIELPKQRQCTNTTPQQAQRGIQIKSFDTNEALVDIQRQHQQFVGSAEQQKSNQQQSNVQSQRQLIQNFASISEGVINFTPNKETEQANNMRLYVKEKENSCQTIGNLEESQNNKRDSVIGRQSTLPSQSNSAVKQQEQQEATFNVASIKEMPTSPTFIRPGDLEVKARHMQVEIDQLNKIIREKQRENQDLKDRSKRVDELEQKIKVIDDRNEKEIKEKAKRITEVENNLKLVIKENDKLNDIIDQKSKENEQLIDNNEKMERSINILSEEVKKLSQIYNEIAKEKEKWVWQYYELEKTIKQKQQNGQQQQEQQEGNYELDKQIEEKINILAQENEKLNNLLQDKVKEADDNNKQALDLQQDLENKIRLLLEENAKLEQVIKSLEAEQESVEDNQQLQVLRQELQQLQQTFRQKQKECEDSDTRIHEYERKIEVIIEENDKLNNLLQVQQQQFSETTRQSVDQLEEKICELCQENEKLVNLVSEKESNVVQITVELDRANQKINELKKGSEQKNWDSDQVKQKLTQIQEENLQLKNQIAAKEDCVINLKQQIGMNKVEMEEKTQTVLQKNDELEKALQVCQVDKEKLIQSQELYVEQLKAEFEKQLSNKINKELQTLNSKYEQEFNRLETENEQKQKINNELISKIDELVQEREKLIQNNQELLMKQDAVSEQQSLDNKQDYKERVKFVEEQLNRVGKENEKLSKLCIDRLRSIDALQKENIIKNENLLKAEVELDRIKQENNKFNEEKYQFNQEIKQLENTNKILSKSKEGCKQELIKLYELLKKQKEVTKPNVALVDALQKELEIVKKDRDECRGMAEQNVIELSKKNKELVERLEELDQLKLKFEQIFDNNNLN